MEPSRSVAGDLRFARVEAGSSEHGEHVGFGIEYVDGTGGGGSKLPDLKAEFTKTLYTRGSVGAARTSDPNTANSQFFICFTNTGCSGLDGQYTVWGEVVSGMELVDKIKRGAPGSGTVTDPDIVVKVTVQ